MITARLRRCVSVGVAILLTACATTDLNKADIGTLLGGAVGGVLGSQVSKDNRALGTVLGTAVGAGIGRMIGQKLDEKDKAALKAKIEQAAEATPNNVPVVWQSDHSGASATVVPADVAREVDTTKSIRKESDVVIQSSPLQLATGQREATEDVNIRTGPGTQHEVKGILRRGKVVEAVGMTNDGWYVVAQDGTAIGYVSGRYLRRPGEGRATIRRQVAAPAETRPQMPKTAVEGPVGQAKRSEETNVRIVGTCRPVRVRVRDKDGQVVEETVTTCQSPDGSWGA